MKYSAYLYTYCKYFWIQVCTSQWTAEATQYYCTELYNLINRSHWAESGTFNGWMDLILVYWSLKSSSTKCALKLSLIENLGLTCTCLWKWTKTEAGWSDAGNNWEHFEVQKVNQGWFAHHRLQSTVALQMTCDYSFYHNIYKAYHQYSTTLMVEFFCCSIMVQLNHNVLHLHYLEW